jgi:hypothetical protein
MRFAIVAALVSASFGFAEDLPFEITHPNYLSQVLPSDQLVGFLELTNPTFGVQQFPQLSVVEVDGKRVGYLSRNNPAQLIIWTTLAELGPDPFMLPIRSPLVDAPASLAGGPVGSTDGGGGGTTPGGGGGTTPGGGGTTPGGGGGTTPGGGGGTTPGGDGGTTPGGGGGTTPGGGGGTTPGGDGGTTPGGGGTDPGPGGGGTDPGPGGPDPGPGGGGTDPGPVALVPEPSSIGMMFLGATAFLFARRARSNRK